MMMINIGCGQTPTKGWRNFDNSFSLRLAKIPLLPTILRRLHLLAASQYQFIKFARSNQIEFADAAKAIPLANNTCDVVYSSHMLEHLDRKGAAKFFNEVLRVLRPGGVVRIVVPDISIHVAHYRMSGDADAFIAVTHMCVPQPVGLAQRVRLLLVGPRHHQWMYDGKSLSGLLTRSGFVDATVLPPGETTIAEPGTLDLKERALASVYVEAHKPTTRGRPPLGVVIRH